MLSLICTCLLCDQFGQSLLLGFYLLGADGFMLCCGLGGLVGLGDLLFGHSGDCALR